MNPQQTSQLHVFMIDEHKKKKLMSISHSQQLTFLPSIFRFAICDVKRVKVAAHGEKYSYIVQNNSSVNLYLHNQK